MVVLTLLVLPYDPVRPAQLDHVYDRDCAVQATDCHVSVYACSLRAQRDGVNAALLLRLRLRLLGLLPCSSLGHTKLPRYARASHRPCHLYASIQLLLRLPGLLPCSTLDHTKLPRYARATHRPYHAYASIQT